MNVHKNARLTAKGREVLVQRLERGQRDYDVACAMGVSLRAGASSGCTNRYPVTFSKLTGIGRLRTIKKARPVNSGNPQVIALGYKGIYHTHP